MKVKLKSIYRGAKGSYDAGDVIDVPSDEGKQLCEGGYAEPVKVAYETASVKPAEKAVKPKAKPRKKKLFSR